MEDVQAELGRLVKYDNLTPEVTIPSVLRHCWLTDNKGIWPVKTYAYKLFMEYFH